MSFHGYSVCSVGVGGEPLASALSRLLSPLDTCSWLLGHLLAPTWNRPFLQDPFLPVGSGVWRPNSGGGTRDLPQGSPGGGSWEDCLTELGRCGDLKRKAQGRRGRGRRGAKPGQRVISHRTPFLLRALCVQSGHKRPLAPPAEGAAWPWERGRCGIASLDNGTSYRHFFLVHFQNFTSSSLVAARKINARVCLPHVADLLLSFSTLSSALRLHASLTSTYL